MVKISLEVLPCLGHYFGKFPTISLAGASVEPLRPSLLALLYTSFMSLYTSSKTNGEAQFVERVIGTTRREYLDHTLFTNATDLENKLNDF